ncbi:MAG: Fe-S cluster assembly protein SufD [Thermoanaerobaculia bacterium]
MSSTTETPETKVTPATGMSGGAGGAGSAGSHERGEFTRTFATAREKRRTQPQPESRRALRDRAWGDYERLGFPTLRDEDWRFTNVAPVGKTAFQIPAKVAPATLAAEIKGFRLANTTELVFVDGRFVPELSANALPRGLRFSNGSDSKVAEDLLGSVCGIETRPFAALATALFEEIVFIEVAKGTVVEHPLHLLFYSTAPGATRSADPADAADRAEPAVVAGATFPRTLIHAAEQSQATIVESFAGPADAVYLTCPITEIVAEPYAVVDHYKFQRDSRAAFHLSALALATSRGSNVSTHSFSLGGGIVRHDIQARLGGEGSEATLNGLYLVDGRQVCDTHMRVDHVAAHCASHELYKGILDGRSRAVFSGRIFVHKGAQKTDAKQTNRNLLLSDDALVNTNPQLEIFADDVKCTHGSTVGQLDEDAIFYLRSRGIGAEAAKSLLTYAFASDLVERAKVPALARELREFLFHWIPQGDVVRDAV